MEIIVLLKQVPGVAAISIDKSRGTLIREGIPAITNPFDEHALEETLRIREQLGGSITAITMGPPQAYDMLQEAISLGADRGILLTDPAFAGADTWATAYTLARAIKTLGAFDLIICGYQAVDGDTAQVGPQVAEFLDIPQITHARSIKIQKSILRVERSLERGYEILECPIPALITVTKEINSLRYATVKNIVYAGSTEVAIEKWNAGDIGAQAEKTGLKGSPTRVQHLFTPTHTRKGIKVTGTTESVVNTLIDELRGKNIF